MAKITAKYETMYILNGTLGEEETAALVQKFRELVEAHGTLTAVEEWGKRRLAYEINRLTDGYYVLMTFESAPSFPLELERVFSITENVLRWLTICKDEK
ncbi:MAG: 30S ribosomal protein S6 [Oscillospiraceae bacterium]|jgi:small subunit ribosomal protein S6|nr:30S ribosomal protein S6 [Oscillospiraceae bacterium]